MSQTSSCHLARDLVTNLFDFHGRVSLGADWATDFSDLLSNVLVFLLDLECCEAVKLG